MWLLNIPRGQLIWIKRNRTEEETFEQQAKLIAKRFTVKGYDRIFIENEIEKVKNIKKRKDLIKDNETSEEKNMNMNTDIIF